MSNEHSSDEDDSARSSTSSLAPDSDSTRWFNPWQAADSGLTSVVLRAVFACLGAAELARAAAVCRAWRAAAACPALWRRLLGALPASTPPGIPWREEYVLLHGGWALSARLAASAGPLLHAALAPGGRRLALTTDDAHVLIWELDKAEEWRMVWRRGLRARGWERVARAHWAAGGDRLLLAGPLALARRWELLVLQRDEEGEWRVESRGACGAGAAGCWAGRAGGACLALEPRRLAPHRRITTVYINAATQETQSEYAGVTAPLLHIFNEEDENITHVAVADVPLRDSASDEDCSSDDEYNEYNDMISGDDRAQVLVAGFGGKAGVLRAWGLRALQPPPLLAAAAAGDLRARRARAAAARAAAALDDEPEQEPEMSEAEVRAMCTPPDAECYLNGTLIGLTVQDNGRCVWACVSGGELTSWALPALRPLRLLTPPTALTPRAPLLSTTHYVQPAIGRRFIVTPEGGLSGRVWVWGGRSGATGAPLAHGAPALAAALPATRHPTLLVLTSDYLYVWRSRATPQMTEDEIYDMDDDRSYVT